jgi:hypothetical protein
MQDQGYNTTRDTTTVREIEMQHRCHLVHELAIGGLSIGNNYLVNITTTGPRL